MEKPENKGSAAAGAGSGTAAGKAKGTDKRFPWWTLPAATVGTFLMLFGFDRYDVSGNYAWLAVFGLGAAACMVCLAAVFLHVIGQTEKPDPDAVKRLRAGAAVTGVVLGLLAMLFAGDQSDKNYDYIVNGVRMAEWQEDLNGRLMLFLAFAVTAALLILFFGWLILRLRRLERKALGRTLLWLPLAAGAVFLGVLASRGVAAAGGGKAAIPEDVFLAAPASAKKGSLVEFGAWAQNGSAKTPVVWRVLQKKDGVLTLLSEYAVAAKTYGYEKGRWTVTYAESDARAFLAGPFTRDAFTEEEKVLLVPVDSGGGNQDLVTLPTLKEAKKFLGKHTTCLPTENVRGMLEESRKGDVEFVLRPDDTESDAVYRYMIADLYTAHLDLYDVNMFIIRPIGIRPVIRIRY